MTNKEKYQKAFSVLKPSGNIRMEDLNMKRFHLSKVVAAAAAAVICFVASNSICYAATGNTWVEKMVVFFDGEAVETDVEVTDLGEGNYSYTLEVPDEGTAEIVVTTDESERNVTSFAIMQEESPYLSKEEGEVWLYYQEGKVNITEDFADGMAGGTMSVDGNEYHYHVSGTVEEYNIAVERNHGDKSCKQTWGN